MKGDFSRFSFRPLENYLSVLRQQGRVELDSDFNEQAQNWAERFRQLTCDVFGHLAVPLSPNSITSDNSRAMKIENLVLGPGGVIDFTVGGGMIYLGGHLYRLHSDVTFRSQPDYPEPDVPQGDGDIIVYVESWRNIVSYIDDELIREPALGGPDTCLREKVVAQVKILHTSGLESPSQAWEFLLGQFTGESLLLTLRIEESADQIPISFGEVDLGGGLIPGNLHVRIELHRGATANGGFIDGFKWSDENAATVVKILNAVSSNTLLVEEAEPVIGESLKEGDWVEVSNVVTEMHRRGGQIARIKAMTQEETGLSITLDQEIHPLLRRLKTGGNAGEKFDLAPRLRRWSGFISHMTPKTVYDLGRGIKAIFNTGGRGQTQMPGDYWTFAIRDREFNKRYAPRKLPSDGVRVFRHPLAIIKRKKKDQFPEIIDCRRFIEPLGKPA